MLLWIIIPAAIGLLGMFIGRCIKFGMSDEE